MVMFCYHTGKKGEGPRALGSEKFRPKRTIYSIARSLGRATGTTVLNKSGCQQGCQGSCPEVPSLPHATSP